MVHKPLAPFSKALDNEEAGLLWAVCTIAIAMLLAGSHPAQATRGAESVVLPWCAADSLHTADFLVWKMRQLATSNLPVYVQLRAALDSMPVVSTTDVALVQDEATCQRGSALLDSVFFQMPRASPVFVIRIGGRYAVYPPGVSTGEFGWVIYADSSFHKIGESRI